LTPRPYAGLPVCTAAWEIERAAHVISYGVFSQRHEFLSAPECLRFMAEETLGYRPRILEEEKIWKILGSEMTTHHAVIVKARSDLRRFWFQMVGGISPFAFLRSGASPRQNASAYFRPSRESRTCLARDAMSFLISVCSSGHVGWTVRMPNLQCSAVGKKK
jgi:hypothetical protein